MSRSTPNHLSTAAQLLAERFPRRTGLIASLMTAVSRQTPPTAVPPGKALFGLAFEYAVGLDLAEELPYEAVFGSLDRPQAERLLRLAGRYPARASADLTGNSSDAGLRGHSARLFTAAAAVALLQDRVLRPSKSSTLEDARTMVHMFVRHRRVLRAWAEEIWDARPAWRAYWASYTGGFREVLCSYGPAEAAPALLGGRRHADLITGSTLVELKAGRLDDPGYVNSVVDQLLTYALLAMRDGRPITHVALYAARYELLMRYPIHDFLDELAGVQLNPTDVAAQLADAIRTNEPVSQNTHTL